MIAQIVVFFRAKLMRKERKILRFVPQKLRKSFANGNPHLIILSLIVTIFDRTADLLKDQLKFQLLERKKIRIW